MASKRGKGGGYVLAQPPENITIGSVIRAIEGPIAPLPCASETRFLKCEECVDIQTCGTRIVMRQVRDAMVAVLDHTSLATICQQVEQATFYMKLVEISKRTLLLLFVFGEYGSVIFIAGSLGLH